MNNKIKMNLFHEQTSLFSQFKHNIALKWFLFRDFVQFIDSKWELIP